MRTLGPYTLSRRLGVGGMGEVWMGRRAALGGASKTVAVKLLTAQRVDDEASRAMFLAEARLSMALNNSNIVQVFDIGETEDGTCYMAMEWIDGLDLARLATRLRRAGEVMSLPLIAYVIGELLKALAYAHDFVHDGVRRTIVHRDISPHNVMVSSNGEVKLMDFGIARMASEETSGGLIKGKLHYMPPEQLRGQTREPTLDLFAVGAVLHELLDGRKFRGGVDEARLLGMIIQGEIEPLTRADVPAEIEALRLGLLAGRIEDRIQSARAAHMLLMGWPGYRDSKFELADLVTRFAREAAAKRAVSLDDQATRRRPATGSGSRPAEVTPSERRTSASGSGRATHPTHSTPGAAMHASAAVSPVTSITSAERSASRSPSSRVVPLAVLIGLGSLGLGAGILGLSRLWSGAAGDPDEEPTGPAVSGDRVAAHGSEIDGSREAPGEGEGPGEPTPRDGPTGLGLPPEASTGGPSPEVGGPKPSTGGPKPETDGPSLEVEATRPTASPRERPAAVAVTIRAPGFKFWVEVRVGGRSFEIDKLGKARAVTRLRPGKYVVELRDDPESPWRRAGEVTITAGDPAILEIRGPKDLAILQ